IPMGIALLLPTLAAVAAGLSLQPGRMRHLGVCPNQLNPNLWVDAQSTCERECQADQDCEGFEKCCTNVCGLRSCVAARFADGSLPALALAPAASCESFVCAQQGSDCDIWDGQPVCKCKDRCEKEPNFTCASDGLTYYNKCYMDAEACLRGTRLTTVPCKPIFTWPDPSPLAECLREPDRRRCEALEVRWHFDAKQGSCLTFRYGGCGANRNHFETYEECRAACLGSARPTCLLPMVQGPCQNWEPRWAYNHLLKQCHSFVYGGCEGNTNNFESKESCEDVCPFPKTVQCKACRLKSKMVLSLCRSDFAIVGRLMEIVEDQDSGIARFALEDVLKDEKMGLKFFNIKYLEVTLTNMDWSCPCPNMTAEDGPLIIMGEVHDGMATLDPSSYVRAANDKRVKKIYELMEKKTCDLLNRF
ncbi:WAP, Kazal, immunoglobulin, Kunitz and NTR domain-containing protein 1, partial [Cuculus canorus]